MRTSSANNNRRTQEVASYTLQDLIKTSLNFKSNYAIMVYDPPTDEFIFIYDVGRMPWGSNVSQLEATFKSIASMIRRAFPERFQGVESEELAIPIASGDMPAITGECYINFPHESDVCPQSLVPILQFGSTFRNEELFPNAIAMPMPVKDHLTCFKIFAKDATDICPSMGRNFAFGDTVGSTSFDNLIPQVVWRGSDFGYLPVLHFLTRPELRYSEETDEVTFKVEERKLGPFRTDPKQKKLIPLVQRKMSALEKKMNAAETLMETFDMLLPRWKGVALTAKAEAEAQIESERSGEEVLPWANIKFFKTRFDVEKNKTGKKVAKQALQIELLEEYGIPYKGESMNSKDLAGYKYQIDLGGGGGTTWTGTLQKLAMPGLLFHHCTPTKDYIHDYIEPWVHYVPIAPDLSDLKEKFDWAEANPKAAKLIADQGTEFVRSLGTTEGFGSLFQDNFIEPVMAVMEGYQPSSTPWREILKETNGIDGHMFEPSIHCNGLFDSENEKCSDTKGSSL